MKSLLWHVVLVLLLAISGATPSRAAESPDLYELRVYMGYRIFDPILGSNTREPEIRMQIEVGKYFFAKNVLPFEPNNKKQTPREAIYVASGVLHPAKDGKFPLERTFMWWGQNTNSLTFGPNTMEIELDKPVTLAVSLGRVKGYTVILSKVTPPTKPISEEGEFGAKTSSAVSRP